MRTRSYQELVRIPTFEERFEYLKLKGEVGTATFGFDRYVNQALYKSSLWKRTRRNAIIRDEGRDLGIEGYEIYGKIIVHHINPITLEDIENEDPVIFDLNNLICVSHDTHNAITYGDVNLLPKVPIERSYGDTKLW